MFYIPLVVYVHVPHCHMWCVLHRDEAGAISYIETAQDRDLRAKYIYISGICPQWSVVVRHDQHLVLTDHNLHLHDHHYILMHYLQQLPVSFPNRTLGLSLGIKLATTWRGRGDIMFQPQ